MVGRGRFLGAIILFLVSLLAADAFAKPDTPILHTFKGKRHHPRSCNFIGQPNIQIRGGDPQALENFKVMFWNFDEFTIEGAEAYFVKGDEMDAYGRSFSPNRTRFKSPKQLKAMAKLIRQRNPKVLIGSEIMDLASARKFAFEYLDNRWELRSFPQNRKSSSVVMFVRRGLPLDLQFESHLDARMFVDGREESVFTRDVPALIARANPKDKRAVVVLGMHAKSMRPSQRRASDPYGDDKRRREFSGVEIIKNVYRQSLDAAFVVAGDMNTDTLNDPSYQILQKDSTSALTLAKIPKDSLDRVTHTYLQRENGKVGYTHHMQLDDILVDKALHPNFVSAKVVRYQDDEGQTLPLMSTLQERNTTMSPHFPVEVVLDLYSYFYGTKD